MKYPKLPKEFKRNWIKALRSGLFRQGKGATINKNSRNQFEYCCLGVAEEVGTGKGPFIGDGYPWTGVPQCLILGRTAEKLSAMNDGLPNAQIPGKTFKQIANWIEKHL